MSSVDLPPVLPDIKEQLQKYLLCPENLPIHQYERNQEFWSRKIDPLELLHFEGSPLSTTLKVQRDPNTGEITDFQEVLVDNAGATAANSMSLNRAPLPPNEATRGSASYIPFWPGSFPNPVLELPEHDLESTELLTIPPGFKKGLTFSKHGRTLVDDTEELRDVKFAPESNNVINLLELIQQNDSLSTWDIKPELSEVQPSEKSRNSVPEEEDILPKDAPVLTLNSAPSTNDFRGSQWAILLDKPVTNFREQIPEMAKEYPFELDNFQKLAILQLEQHNHVFVAAHTSAGKTVVAEYAIALSQKHKSRTIYTSPIKALSNQKYRDFKKEFQDVGLITGDFQINQTASCLIMTTEILRTMLYCGSDIVRDLEYVIFDEVHYVNDRERGHVWEQVLILLPPHVCVVLLSATVPNTEEFADWLGRTHQRKVYVVTTPHRPVPLHHFLYTGKGGSSRHNRFAILQNESWKMEGYVKAKESIKVDTKKLNYHGLNPAQEKTLWSGLVDHLKKNDLLPVVGFTFSRKKCDMNAISLTNLDLTTQKEKSHINMFFNKCIRFLKKPDQEIPQILNMRNILTRGIGVHHSGILPIVKEIVEMLFQRGLIKLLFATETFAMGVNMPARTVVFDSVRKHDGIELRDLHPAEYIQMAGRAGRRGLDTEGTVIILCKQGVPSADSLRQMMLGKPDKLVSQFRLTYGMVLSLLRVESLGVEGMMSRSFREADHQKRFDDIKKDFETVKNEIDELCQQELSSYLQPLVKFYDSASAYLRCHEDVMPLAVVSPKLQKVLVPGRYLLITYKTHINKLALLLNNSRCKVFKVLVLTDTTTAVEGVDKQDLWYRMLALAQERIFTPLSGQSHEILTIGPADIFQVSGKSSKVNVDLVIRDWEKRQLERFRHDPLGETCAQAVQELQKLTLLANDNSTATNKLEFYDFIADLKVNEQNIYHHIVEMNQLRDKLIDDLPSTRIPNFEQQFSLVFNRKFLEEKKKNLEFLMSKNSLSLYPEYTNRIELLRGLDYIDDQYRVRLKGRVACEMGMNELLITELVLRNVFTRLKTAEVAALLSALVFRVKLRHDGTDENEEDLTEDLKRGMKEMKQVHEEIAKMELRLGIPSDEFQKELNFGLVHVVYKWATAEPFSEIMKLTDIQEGIIVRCIQQLNDAVCDVKNAARLVGDPELRNKMEETSMAIKRDIVFAASLYTHDEAI